jgi:hypothetical protein
MGEFRVSIYGLSMTFLIHGNIFYLEFPVDNLDVRFPMIGHETLSELFNVVPSPYSLRGLTSPKRPHLGGWVAGKHDALSSRINKQDSAASSSGNSIFSLSSDSKYTNGVT